MAEKAQEVKVKYVKKKGGHAAAHGGAWKVAYADLVTAMMSFFLLMWLLNSQSAASKAGIAGYMREGASFFNTEKGQSILAEFGKGILPGSRGMNVQAQEDGKDDAENDPNEKERRLMEATKAAIEGAFDSDKLLMAFKEQISIDFTEEGLRIQIKDKEDQALFDSGSDRLKPYMMSILGEIGKELGKLSNHIVVGGHTDAIPYASRGYSNWDLSSARANSALRAMQASGVKAGQVKRVTGYAETVPLEEHDPKDPQNRRISIVVLSSSFEAREDARGKAVKR